MDFGFSEDQQGIQALTKQMCRDMCAPEALDAIEAGDGFHEALWGALAKAQMLGLSLPESCGGIGLGFTEQCILLEQTGRHVAPVPLWSTFVCGALPLATFALDAHRDLLASVAKGETRLTGAFDEPGNLDPRRPATRAEASGSGYTLTGEKVGVFDYEASARVVVSATDADGPALFVIEPGAAGAIADAQTGTDDSRQHAIRLEGTPAIRLGGRDALDWTLDRANVGLAAMSFGLAQTALITSAKYTAERQQFDRPIATFQAVAQRLADAWIDVESMRVTLWRAVWLLDRGEPAAREVEVCRMIACEAGHRVVCAAQHVHGGMGFDRDYPLYRYYLRQKQLEHVLGGARSHLARLGDLIADRSAG